MVGEEGEEAVRLLAIDLETTGLDPKTDHVIEIGTALWDTDRKAVLYAGGAFIALPPGVVLDPKITALTGITQADLDEWGRPLEDALSTLSEFCTDHGVVHFVGHNAKAFDRLFVEASLPRLTWLDTMTDLPLPENMKARALSHLAAEHGFLNPFPHRALFDALTCLRLLACYPLEEVIRYATAPTVTLIAWNLPFERKDEAKNAGFQWDAAGRRWSKTVKDFQVEALKASLTFTTRVA